MRELCPIYREVSKISDSAFFLKCFISVLLHVRLLYFLPKEVGSTTSLFGDDVEPKGRGFG